MFEDSKVLITGGTGSLGQALTKRLLSMDVSTIRIFSRNESKQIEMEREFEFDSRLRFLIGDIRDKDRLIRAVEGVDMVFHGAALKHVPVIEYNPFEGIQTNVIGSQNVVEACIANNVDVAIGISTDKSVAPLNTYGATKLLMEKIFATANNFLNPEKHRTKFMALRYGNVLGSRGSVIPLWDKKLENNKPLPITHPEMTRYFMTIPEAVQLLLQAASIGDGGEIFLLDMGSPVKIIDLARKMIECSGLTPEVDVKINVIGVRPGEKMHEERNKGRKCGI